MAENTELKRRVGKAIADALPSYRVTWKKGLNGPNGLPYRYLLGRAFDPKRYETDILVTKPFKRSGAVPERVPSGIPLVVVEVKGSSGSTNDSIDYADRATMHRHLYPWLRYGMVTMERKIGWRFLAHMRDYDFIVALGRERAEQDQRIREVAKAVRKESQTALALLDLWEKEAEPGWFYQVPTILRGVKRR
jgi:hypothetical protein